MAAQTNYRIIISPCSSGTVGGGNHIKKSTPSSKFINEVHDTVTLASDAQIAGVMNYIGLIRAGDDTSTVETAITALTP